MIMSELSGNCNTRILHWRGAVVQTFRSSTKYRHKFRTQSVLQVHARNNYSKWRDGRRTASISCHWVRIEMTSDKLISTAEDFGPWLTAESCYSLFVFVCLFLVALHFNSKYTGQNISCYLRTVKKISVM